MDKLLLSPDYSVLNSEVNIETNKALLETLQVKTNISPVPGPKLCKTPSPILDVVSSPSNELLEFLTFHNKTNRRMNKSPLVSDPAWALIPTTLQCDTEPQLFPKTASPDLGLLDTEVFPHLENVVASANLHCKLDLRRIAMYAQNAEYNPRRLPVLYMRIRNPSALALIFGNGKLICTGSTNVQTSHRATRKFARIIQRLGFPVKFANYKVENLIASCEVRFHIRLELFELFMHTHCVYEPELFPGLIFRVARSRAQILIFSSGRIILSGAKQNCELQKSLRQIYPLLKLFEKKS